MKKTALLIAISSVMALNTYAAQTEITIYNQNLALLKKSQTADLKIGSNDIVFNEVAEQMQPDSAYIYGNGIRVLEQNYDYAGINYMTLLNANIGKTVKTVRQKPETGENIFENAVLVATDGMTPVLKFNYGIETAFPGRVLFDNIPPELNSTPVLMAKVETATAGEKELNLAYLASGFSWTANYIAKINNDKTLSLIGRAAITNNSGSGYEQAKVNLVAGDVNIVRNVMQPRLMNASRNVKAISFAAMDSMEEMAVMGAPSSMDSYYIYNIPGTTTLKNGQMKQISFISAPEVKYEKEGVIVSNIYFSTNKPYYKDVHPNVYYHFLNNKDDGLGMPLPQGKISFYAPDDNGSLQFIGENTIDNKAEGQKVSSVLGKFFDVYGEGKITEARPINTQKYKKHTQDNCPTTATTYQYDTTYKVTNKGNKDVNIVLKQPLNGDTKLIKESLTGKDIEGNTHEWRFTLKAGEEQQINITTQNTIEKVTCD